MRLIRWVRWGGRVVVCLALGCVTARAQDVAVESLDAAVEAAAPSAEVQADSEKRTIESNDVQGGGGWKRSDRPKTASQGWALNLHRTAPNLLEGTVSLQGSPLATVGNAKISINGSSVSGTITGEDGQLVAKVGGEITKHGVKGTYTDRTGEVGDWEWEGQLPE